ncbi:hypothetical protein QOZ80_3AG0209580 [Eleusine coracana subsp. coracana]|nr:hypothetical protein QOZ80_3AG0209580 [Eleusine coracana subsp. coracana]
MARGCRPYRYSPSHHRFRDVPVCELNVEGGLEEYASMIRKRRRRLKEIAAFHYQGVPVTPKVNPKFKDSHHILRLTSDNAKHLKVDLLIRDTDLYLIAFRRQLHGVWGNWYKYDDLDVPSFITALQMGIKSSYSQVEYGKEPTTHNPTVGGTEDLRDIFFTLASHEDHLRKNTCQLRRALYRALILFSEALRFRCVLVEIARRFRAGEQPTSLPGWMTKRITSWSVLSLFVLRTQRRLALPIGHIDQCIDENQLRTFHVYGITSFDQLIGPNGDILVILNEKNSHEQVEEEEEEEGEEYIIPDPGFQD